LYCPESGFAKFSVYGDVVKETNILSAFSILEFENPVYFLNGNFLKSF
jgi:hypothetical protein